MKKLLAKAIVAILTFGVTVGAAWAGNAPDGVGTRGALSAVSRSGGQPAVLAARDTAGSGDARGIFGARSAAAVASLPAGAAGGVVVRRTAEAARFVVTPLKGVFKPGADVSFYDPAGAFVARGKVKSFYTDEIYVDAEEAKAGSIGYGFVVAMNVSDAGARDLIAKNEEFLASITDQIRDEAAARNDEIGREAKAMERTRRQEQVDFQRQKMQLDYAYGYYYWGWYR